MRRITVLVGALLAMAAIAAPAHSSTLPLVSASLNEAGGGSLTVIGGSNPGEQTWSWQICDAAGESCSRVGTGERIGTGAPSAGTTFRATSNTGLTGLSPVWNGPLRVASPSSATGALQADQLVTPVPAVWQGGWTGDTTQTHLSLCPTAAGVGCLEPRETGSGSCPAGSLTVDPDFTGWWLRVATTVYGPEPARALESAPPLAKQAQPALPFSPGGYGREIWPAGPTTSLAVVGEISRATGPRTTGCGPPPLVPGLPPAVAVKVRGAAVDRHGVVTVYCYSACTVSFHASRHGHFWSVTKTAEGEIQLQIPHRSLARLGRGAVRYTLFIDGHVAAHRTS